MPIDTGMIYVSAYGFYLSGEGGLYPWSWGFSWILRSDWAELVFVTWALAVHPRHPQLLTGGWLPPGWLDWAAGHHWTRLVSPAITART